MTDFPDYQEPQANATALATTNLVGTGLAREAGGNLDTHTKLLGGTQAGALIANIGATIGQEVAAQIATGTAGGAPGGTPLLHGAKQVFSVIGQVIAASGTFATGAIPIGKPGYLIRVQAQMSAAGSVTPYLQADLTWSVTPNPGQITSEEIWYVNCGATSSVRTTGKGPTKGNQLNIAFTNGDAVNSVTITVQVWETTQHIPRDDWRNSGGVASSTATAIRGDGLANIMASDSFSVPNGGNAARNLPLYAGQASVWINQNAGAGSQVNISPVGDFSLASVQPVAALDWTVVTRAPVPVILPRCPCQVLAFNGAAVAFNLLITIMALEYVS